MIKNYFNHKFQKSFLIEKKPKYEKFTLMGITPTMCECSFSSVHEKPVLKMVGFLSILYKWGGVKY